jgi:hypothetical protein
MKAVVDQYHQEMINVLSERDRKITENSLEKLLQFAVSAKTVKKKGAVNE